jgi:putative MFS transporter
LPLRLAAAAGGSGAVAAAATPAPAGGPVPPAATRARLLVVSLLFFLAPWSTVGFALVSGPVILAKGHDLGDALLYVGVALFGPAAGTLLGSLVVDRLERRRLIVAVAAAVAVLGLAFAAVDGPAWLIGTSLALTLVGSLYLPLLVLYAAEIFSTGERATATSVAWAVGRVASALVPLALLPLFKANGGLTTFAVIAATCLAAIAVIQAFGPPGRAALPVA